MMLCTALNKMIDRTECLLFLNTENSTIKAVTGDLTYSQWLYFEIENASTIRRQSPRRISTLFHADETRMLSEMAGPSFKYRIDISSFCKLENEHLLRWKYGKSSSEEHVLDQLYLQTGVLEKKSYY